jgi:hypothetical protein
VCEFIYVSADGVTLAEPICIGVRCCGCEGLVADPKSHACPNNQSVDDDSSD